MHRLNLVALPATAFLLSGCLGTVADVVTAPVKVASKGVDLATTSQSEADEKRGRELRKREERLGKLERDYEKQLDECEALIGRGEKKAAAKTLGTLSRALKDTALEERAKDLLAKAKADA